MTKLTQGRFEFVTFDNEFDFDGYLWNKVVNGTISTDYNERSLTLTSVDKDCYTATYDIPEQTGYMNLVPGNTYRVSYSFDNQSDIPCELRFMTFEFPTTDLDSSYRSMDDFRENAEANASGKHTFEFTVPEGKPYCTVRFGILTAGATVKFSDLYIQNITNDEGNTDDITGPTHSISVNYNDTISSLPIVTRTGYDFVGWFTGKNGTGIMINDETVITENLRVYSYWEKQNQ